MNAPLVAARFGSGKNVRRVEDPALVAGRGRFTDDIALPGQAHMVFLRSPYAHARIKSIDVRPALGMAGVVAAYTGADLVQAGVKTLTQPVPFPRPDGTPGATAKRYALAHETVRFVGEAVVAIVADSRESATNAAEAVLVNYEEMACVVDALDAMKEGAPALCPEAPDNIAAEMRHGDATVVAQAFANAAHTVSVDIVNQRLAPSALEPRSVAIELEAGTDRLVIHLSSQMPTSVRDGVAGALGIDASQVRVLVNDVGGGFGMKTGLYPEDVVVAHAARSLKRPVRWNSQRIEEFQASTHGRDQVTHAEMALDANGKVLGLRVRSIANIGAYATGTNVVIPLLVGPWVTTSVYDIPAIDLHLTAVMTNTMLIGAYRGAGRPEAIYVTERLMDAAAREMKLDPSELRRRNLIGPHQMPYTNPMKQVYDCGEFEKIMDRTLELADWKGFESRRTQSLARGKLRGRGISTFLEWTGGNVLTELVTVNVLPEGIIELTSATQGMGQGIQTSYVQLAVDVFGVPPERIRIVQGDTDVANGFGSAGSRSLFTGGSAVKVASEQTIDHAKSLAAQALEAAAADIEYGEGRFTVAGTDVGIDLFELAGKQQDARIHVEASASASAPSWPNACHICEVEIDPETGEIEIAAYASVNDIGRVVSPAIVRGQVDGGAVQGIGQALCEQVVYDKESGQLLTATFMDYAMPRAEAGRVFKTEFDTSIPCTTNPLGVKGVGELGTIGATPTVVTAVIDALASKGLGRDAEKVQMPLTGMEIWRALRGEFAQVSLR